MVIAFPALTTYRWSCQDEFERFAVDNPATGKVITMIQAGNQATVAEAVKASKAAHEKWRKTSPVERSQYRLRDAAELEKHADEIGTISTMENGKPFADGRNADVNFSLLDRDVPVL